MTTRSNTWLVAVAVTAAGCSNLGPFRANGDDDGADAAVGGDGGHGDGATGVDGQHIAQPRELGSTTKYPEGLAAAGGYVYFTEQGSAPYAVARIPAVGGNVARISLGPDSAGSIAARDGAVVWVTGTAVVRANSAFTSGDALVTTTKLSGLLALSSTDVYYSRTGSGSTNSLERVALAGGSADPLYTNLSMTAELATSATDLYWTAYGTGYELRKSSLTTPGSFTTLATSAAGNPSAHGNVACWVVQPDINDYKYDVWCHRQGTAARIARDFAQVFDVLVTETDVYMAARGAYNVGQIWRYNFATKAFDPYVTLDDGDLPTALATDGTDLFWTAYHTAPEGSAAFYALAL